MILIRPFAPDDAEPTDDICRLTGYAGKDSRPYFTDPDLLPDLYLRPLVEAEPDLAFTAVDGGRPVGYLVATSDTVRYAHWFREVWIPRVGAQHPLPEEPSNSWDDIMTGVFHDPEDMVQPELAGYPAHLHMNMLAECRRQGLGTRMVALLLEALRRKGVPGIHAAPSKYNINSRQFYKRVNFTPVKIAHPGPIRFVARRILPDGDAGPAPRPEDLPALARNAT